MAILAVVTIKIIYLFFDLLFLFFRAKFQVVEQKWNAQ